MELSNEQKKALALARARQRAAQGSEFDAADTVKSFGEGVRTGVEETAALPGLSRQVSERAVKSVLPESTPEWVSNVAGKLAAGPLAAFAPSRNEVRQLTDPVLGSDRYRPTSTAGKYARTVGEFLPGIVAGPGGVVRKGVTQVALPALASEYAGQKFEGTRAEPYARVAGAMAGAMAPSALARLATPFPISAGRQKIVDTLKREGIDLTAGQRTGSQSLRYAESELGGGKAAAFMEKQGEQFTKAALKRAGADASRATPEVVDKTFRTLGKKFEDLSARNTLVPDQRFIDDLAATFENYDYKTLVGKHPVVGKMIGKVLDRVENHGSIPGDMYQPTRSRLERLARGSRSDPEKAEALRGIRRALDDAMERSIAANNPADLGAWKDVRRKYKNLMVLEKAATRAGEAAAEGLISPSALRGAVVSQGRREYARGQGDLAELARAGEATMKPLPQSGTAPRTAARNLGTSMTALLGAGGGAQFGGPLGAMGGMMIGGALPYAAGRAMLSAPGRAYLGNQMVSPLADLGQAGQSAIIAALLARNAEARPAPVENLR